MIDVISEVTESRAEYRLCGGLKVETLAKTEPDDWAPAVWATVDSFSMELAPDDDEQFLIELGQLLDRYKQRRLAFVKTQREELRKKDPERAKMLDGFLAGLQNKLKEQEQKQKSP